MLVFRAASGVPVPPVVKDRKKDKKKKKKKKNKIKTKSGEDGVITEASKKRLWDAVEEIITSVAKPDGTLADMKKTIKSAERAIYEQLKTASGKDNNVLSANLANIVRLVRPHGDTFRVAPTMLVKGILANVDTDAVSKVLKMACINIFKRRTFVLSRPVGDNVATQLGIESSALCVVDLFNKQGMQAMCMVLGEDIEGKLNDVRTRLVGNVDRNERIIKQMGDVVKAEEIKERIRIASEAFEKRSFPDEEFKGLSEDAKKTALKVNKNTSPADMYAINKAVGAKSITDMVGWLLVPSIKSGAVSPAKVKGTEEIVAMRLSKPAAGIFSKLLTGKDLSGKELAIVMRRDKRFSANEAREKELDLGMFCFDVFLSMFKYSDDKEATAFRDAATAFFLLGSESEEGANIQLARTNVLSFIFSNFGEGDSKKLVSSMIKDKSKGHFKNAVISPDDVANKTGFDESALAYVGYSPDDKGWSSFMKADAVKLIKKNAEDPSVGKGTLPTHDVDTVLVKRMLDTIGFSTSVKQIRALEWALENNNAIGILLAKPSALDFRTIVSQMVLGVDGSRTSASDIMDTVLVIIGDGSVKEDNLENGDKEVLATNDIGIEEDIDYLFGDDEEEDEGGESKDGTSADVHGGGDKPGLEMDSGSDSSSSSSSSSSSDDEEEEKDTSVEEKSVDAISDGVETEQVRESRADTVRRVRQMIAQCTEDNDDVDNTGFLVDVVTMSFSSEFTELLNDANVTTHTQNENEVDDLNRIPVSIRRKWRRAFDESNHRFVKELITISKDYSEEKRDKTIDKVNELRSSMADAFKDYIMEKAIKTIKDKDEEEGIEVIRPSPDSEFYIDTRTDAVYNNELDFVCILFNDLPCPYCGLPTCALNKDSADEQSVVCSSSRITHNPVEGSFRQNGATSTCLFTTGVPNPVYSEDDDDRVLTVSFLNTGGGREFNADGVTYEQLAQLMQEYVIHDYAGGSACTKCRIGVLMRGAAGVWCSNCDDLSKRTALVCDTCEHPICVRSDGTVICSNNNSIILEGVSSGSVHWCPRGMEPRFLIPKQNVLLHLEQTTRNAWIPSGECDVLFKKHAWRLNENDNDTRFVEYASALDAFRTGAYKGKRGRRVILRVIRSLRKLVTDKEVVVNDDEEAKVEEVEEEAVVKVTFDRSKVSADGSTRIVQHGGKDVKLTGFSTTSALCYESLAKNTLHETSLKTMSRFVSTHSVRYKEFEVVVAVKSYFDSLIKYNGKVQSRATIVKIALRSALVTLLMSTIDMNTIKEKIKTLIHKKVKSTVDEVRWIDPVRQYLPLGAKHTGSDNEIKRAKAIQRSIIRRCNRLFGVTYGVTIVNRRTNETLSACSGDFITGMVVTDSFSDREYVSNSVGKSLYIDGKEDFSNDMGMYSRGCFDTKACFFTSAKIAMDESTSDPMINSKNARTFATETYHPKHGDCPLWVEKPLGVKTNPDMTRTEPRVTTNRIKQGSSATLILTNAAVIREHHLEREASGVHKFIDDQMIKSSVEDVPPIVKGLKGRFRIGDREPCGMIAVTHLSAAPVDEFYGQTNSVAVDQNMPEIERSRQRFCSFEDNTDAIVVSTVMEQDGGTVEETKIVNVAEHKCDVAMYTVLMMHRYSLSKEYGEQTVAEMKKFHDKYASALFSVFDRQTEFEDVHRGIITSGINFIMDAGDRVAEIEEVKRKRGRGRVAHMNDGDDGEAPLPNDSESDSEPERRVILNGDGKEPTPEEGAAADEQAQEEQALKEPTPKKKTLRQSTQIQSQSQTD